MASEYEIRPTATPIAMAFLKSSCMIVLFRGLDPGLINTASYIVIVFPLINDCSCVFLASYT